MRKNIVIKISLLKKAVSQSSKMEGQNFSRAKKNVAMIKKLKRYGRAFSL